MKSKLRPLYKRCTCAGVYSCVHFGAAGYGVVEVFKSIPTTKDIGIGEVATREANRAVTEELRGSEATQVKPPRRIQCFLQQTDGTERLATPDPVQT